MRVTELKGGFDRFRLARLTDSLVTTCEESDKWENDELTMIIMLSIVDVPMTKPAHPMFKIWTGLW